MDVCRQPVFFSFVLDKPPGYKVFSQPETVLLENLKKGVFKNISIYLENDNNEEVDSNGETITFTLQMIKI